MREECGYMKKTPGFLGGIVLIFVGLFFGIIYYNVFYKALVKYENGLPQDAEYYTADIVDAELVSSHYNTNKNRRVYDNSITVEYEIDGNKYTAQYRMDSSVEIAKGEQVRVLVSKSEPTKILGSAYSKNGVDEVTGKETSGFGMFNIAMTVICSAFILFGIFDIIRTIIRRKRISRENGIIS